MKAFVIAEHDGITLNGSTARTVACAHEAAETVGIAVFATPENADSLGKQAAMLECAESVFVIRDNAHAHPVANIFAPEIVSVFLALNYSHIFAPGTSFGKDLLPRVAALLGVPQVSNIMRVVDSRVFENPAYAENCIVTTEVCAPYVCGTVRMASFKEVARTGDAKILMLERVSTIPNHTRFLSLEKSEASGRPELQSARIVVSGGAGVGSKENFKLLFQLAEKLGAAVGASRVAVDLGFIPNDCQVGQSGKTIAPQIYIAFGISGAPQHCAGIKDAGTIIAVNKDPKAAIFEIADIGFVGDLFEVISAMRNALDERR